jgi:hypothetical protein
MNSSTRVSLVSAAVAAILGTTAGAATPLNPQSNWANAQVYYAGGGSAEVQAVFVAVNKLLTNVSVIADGTGYKINTNHPQSLSYLIILGQAAQAFSDVTSGATVGFIYKYNGGSGPNGAVPNFVSSSNAAALIPYPTAAVIETATAQAGYASGSTPTSLNPNYAFTPGATTSIQPHWGITDTEPSLFNFSWNVANATQPAFSTANGLTKPLFVDPVGVAVTANIFAHKTKFSKGEVAEILTSKVSDWSALNGDNGSPLAQGPILFLDRSAGSGTRASAFAYFLDYPAGALASTGGAIEPFDILHSGSVISGPIGSNGSLTSIPSAYEDIKEPSSSSEADDLVAANKSGVGAIAILGLEFPPVYEQGVPGTNSYDFVAINGTFPDSESGADNINSNSGGSTQYSNIITGLYDFAVQTSFNTPSGSTITTATGGFEQAVYANLASQNLSGAFLGSGFPTATDGVLLDPVNWPTPAPGVLGWTRGANTTAPPHYVTAPDQANSDPL